MKTIKKIFFAIFPMIIILQKSTPVSSSTGTYQELINGLSPDATLETLKATCESALTREFMRPNTDIAATRFLSNAISACKARAADFKRAGDQERNPEKKIQWYRGCVRLIAKGAENQSLNPKKGDPDLSKIIEHGQIKPNYYMYKGQNTNALPLSPSSSTNGCVIVDHSCHTTGFSGIHVHQYGKPDDYWLTLVPGNDCTTAKNQDKPICKASVSKAACKAKITANPDVDASSELSAGDTKMSARNYEGAHTDYVACTAVFTRHAEETQKKAAAKANAQTAQTERATAKRKYIETVCDGGRDATCVAEADTMFAPEKKR